MTYDEALEIKAKEVRNLATDAEIDDANDVLNQHGVLMYAVLREDDCGGAVRLVQVEPDMTVMH